MTAPGDNEQPPDRPEGPSADGRPRAPGTGPPNGLATAGLILGILAGFTGPLTGIAAMICSIIALTRPGRRGWAIAGLFFGFAGSFLPLILLYSVWKVRESAERSKDANNLKIVGIGTHAFNDANQKLPPVDGPVSWRVHLLPFIEQYDLYLRFDLKQDWDGPTNKRLARQQIRWYVSVSDPPETVETRYRVFVGPGTLFEPGGSPVDLLKIPDGMSNTFFAIEAGETVPWPQPKELPYTRTGPLPPLGVPDRSVVQVLMADGSVRSFSTKTSPEVVRGGIEPNDGRGFDP